MDLIDYGVSVINCRLQPQPGLEVTARVFDLHAKQLWNGLQSWMPPPMPIARLSGLTACRTWHFCVREVGFEEQCGTHCVRQFLLAARPGTSDYKVLQTLPPVKLESASKIEDRGAEKLVRVTVRILVRTWLSSFSWR